MECVEKIINEMIPHIPLNLSHTNLLLQTSTPILKQQNKITPIFSFPQTTTQHFRDNGISSPLKETTQIVRPLNIKADIHLCVHFTQVIVESVRYSKEEESQSHKFTNFVKKNTKIYPKLNVGVQ